jgi:hypothetical protein
MQHSPYAVEGMSCFVLYSTRLEQVLCKVADGIESL